MKRLALPTLVLVLILFGCTGGDEPVISSKDIQTINDLNSAVSILQEEMNIKARRYSTYDFGRMKDNDSISFIVSEGNAFEILPILRRSLGSGLMAFIGTTRWLGDEEHKGVEVVIANGTSKYDILRVARTDAVNYDMLTEDIVKKIEEYDNAYGVDILQAETDTIQFRLNIKPNNMMKFSKDLYEFCPDIVDQGVGSIDKLAEYIQNNDIILLWWD